MKKTHLTRFVHLLPHGKYAKEIKYYFILLLIPVFLLALLYINVNQVVKRQADEYAKLMTNHFYVQSNSMLHEMQMVSNSILESSEISRVLEAEDANSLNSLSVCQVLQNCLNESSQVQHAYLFCYESGIIYTDQGLFGSGSLSSILREIGIDESELWADASSADYRILNENRLAPFGIFPIHNEQGKYTGTLIVTLNMVEFLHIFYSLDAELCAIFNEDVYISSYIQNFNTEEFDWYNEENISSLVGKSVVCNYLEGDNYTYLIAISRETYNSPLHVIIKWFFIYAAAAVVLGYIYLYRVSKKRYRNISAMIEALPIPCDGNHSYEQVYESIRKTLEDYRTQRENLWSENRERSLHALLSAEGEHSATADQFESLGIPQDSGSYYVVTFFTDSRYQDGKERGQDTSCVLHLFFRSTVLEVAEQLSLSCVFCGGYKTGSAVLYGGDPDKLRKIVCKFSQNVIDILTHSYAAAVQATVSSPVASVTDLPSAYRATHQLRSFARSVNSDAVLLSQEDLQHDSGVLLNGDFIRQEQILINTILVQKYEAVPSMVESILFTHVSPLRKDYTLAQNRLMSIANILAEGIRTSSVPESLKEEYAKSIEASDSVRQLEAVSRTVYGLMSESRRETTSEMDIVAIACQYISQHLSDPNLNVAAICEAAGVSVQRLTRMFQAQFNMAIAEYMNYCRIKLAKELLREHLTIVQIARQVGYGNADTFTRNFRKLEGITASEYRKLLSRN